MWKEGGRGSVLYLLCYCCGQILLELRQNKKHLLLYSPIFLHNCPKNV